MSSGIDIERVKAELEKAYARLKAMPLGDDSAELLREIERLERELLALYAAYVEKRDSTNPPKS